MKRRVVAIFLSLTLCMGGTLEAGAAALESTDVQMAAAVSYTHLDVYKRQSISWLSLPEISALVLR